MAYAPLDGQQEKREHTNFLLAVNRSFAVVRGADGDLRSRGLFVSTLKWLGYEVESPMTSLSFVINLMARFDERAKWLPLLLPGCVFLWDFAALQWVFAHEPGITARVVFYFDLALLPGTLLFSPMPAMLFNCSLACLIGLVVWLVRRERANPSRA